MHGKSKAKLVIGAIAAVSIVLCLLFIWRAEPSEEPVSTPPQTEDIWTPEPEPTGSGAFIPGASWDLPGDTTHAGDASHSYEQPSAEIQYRNDKSLSIICNEQGDTITVDNGNANDVKDAIILNFQMSDEEKKVGYYITSSRNELHFSSDAKWGALDAPANQGHSNFVINWTYNELIPIEDNMVSWSNDLLYDGKEKTGTTLYVRALDIGNGGQLISTFKVEIAFRDGAYQLDEISGTDVSVTGKLGEEERSALLLNAFSLAKNEVLGLDGILAADLQAETEEDVLSYGKVEYLGDRMYYPVSVSPAGRAVTSSQFTAMYHDIYAVTLPTLHGGAFTMYYSPDVSDELEVNIQAAVLEQYGDTLPEGIELPELAPVTNEQLRFFATDPYNLHSRSANVPTGYFR